MVAGLISNISILSIFDYVRETVRETPWGRHIVYCESLRAKVRVRGTRACKPSCKELRRARPRWKKLQWAISCVWQPTREILRARDWSVQEPEYKTLREVQCERNGVKVYVGIKERTFYCWSRSRSETNLNIEGVRHELGQISRESFRSAGLCSK